MNEKEFNRAIVAELAKIAKDYFAELSIPAGTYTASELANGKKGKEEIVMSAPDEIRDALHVVRVESFRCQFTSESVFSLLAKFEKLAGVGQKEKAHFVRMNESENVPCRFTADFGKGAKWAVNQVTKDVARFPMTCALLNVERGELVASDGYMLSVTSVPVIELSGELPEFPVLLNAEMIKNLKGKCHVRVLQDGITVEDESGKQYVHKYELNRYPNYLNVIPDVSDELRATFTPNAVKSISSLLKSAKKTCCLFNVDIEEGERMAKITPVNMYYYHEVPSIQVELSECPKSEIHVAFVIDYFSRARNWDGRIWFGRDSSRPVVLGDNCAKLTVVMPNARRDDSRHSYKPMETYDAFDAVCGTIAKEGLGTPNLPSHYIVEDEAERISQANSEYNVPTLYCVPDSIVAGFIESLCSMLSVLCDMIFFITLNDAIKQIRQLAYLSGKDYSDLINDEQMCESHEKSDEIDMGIPNHPCLNYMIRHTFRIRPSSRPVIVRVDKYTPARVFMPENDRIAANPYSAMLHAAHESSPCADGRIVGYFHIRGPTTASQTQLARN